jgi:hypothetical protein
VLRYPTNLVPALLLSIALAPACGGEGDSTTLFDPSTTAQTFTGMSDDTGADATATASDTSSSTQADTTAGDGDSSTASGDGDSSTASGDGDSGDGDSGDGDSGDGDGDTTSGDGDTTSTTTSGETGTETGCEGVDFLFVIDNSGSMGDEQTALIASFDGFIDSIQAQLGAIGADSFNIMVTDTDAAELDLDPTCLLSCAANNYTGTCLFTGDPCELYSPGCTFGCQLNPTGTCMGFACSELADCDDACGCEIGAGVVTTPGGGSCGVTGGNLYIDQNQADPKAAFSCMANVGTSGSGSERQMDAMTQAISTAMNNPGGCNEAFVRQNAILVVTVITDEPDSNSGGDPASWKSALMNAKFNDEAGIVVLGLIGDTDQPMPVCGSMSGNDGASPAPQIRQFVESMQNGVTGSVCAPSYNEFFADAVALIEDTCISFPIPE